VKLAGPPDPELPPDMDDSEGATHDMCTQIINRQELMVTEIKNRVVEVGL